MHYYNSVKKVRCKTKSWRHYAGRPIFVQIRVLKKKKRTNCISMRKHHLNCNARNLLFTKFTALQKWSVFFFLFSFLLFKFSF